MNSQVEKPIVMFDGPEAATYRTDIKGWVSRDGLFYGDTPSSERGARWSGCTHQTRECGKVHAKSRTVCDSCYAKSRTDKYYALEMVEWDGLTPVVGFDDDRYFFDEDSILDYLAEIKDDSHKMGFEPEVQLVLCVPHQLRLLDGSEWEDDLPEDGELPDEVAQKLDELNEAIKASPTACWFPGKIRINMEPLWKQLETEEVSR